MDTQNPSAPSRAQSALGGNQPPSRATRHPRSHPHRTAARPAGVAHENTRHTTRFTVIGNHLTQHQELSLLAIGVGCHIQSLPAGVRVDIKSLAARFPEGATRIAAALRELEAHGYLRRERERTPAGRIVTRTISCNQPHAAPQRHPHALAPQSAQRHPHSPTPQASHHHPGALAPPQASPPPGADAAPAAHARPKEPRPLPAVPHPAFPAPSLLQQATDLLADLRHHDPRLLLTTRDTAHLAPGVAAWLEREVDPASVRHALTHDLPPEGPRRPAALLAHRLTALLPPPPPFHGPASARHPLQNCDACDRAFRAPEPGLCRDCHSSPHTHSPGETLGSVRVREIGVAHRPDLPTRHARATRDLDHEAPPSPNRHRAS
ncbi:helix-turn-helix domain-containing protein [Streptomyces sp. SYP-A7185]|uniref:helix-turn-helix domain-containing protein n=1 Tax=Streptomyces sp. SYP-A7185 TaxID=3040076 RepID=UPI0038F71558